MILHPLQIQIQKYQEIQIAHCKLKCAESRNDSPCSGSSDGSRRPAGFRHAVPIIVVILLIIVVVIAVIIVVIAVIIVVILLIAVIIIVILFLIIVNLHMIVVIPLIIVAILLMIVVILLNMFALLGWTFRQVKFGVCLDCPNVLAVQMTIVQNEHSPNDFSPSPDDLSPVQMGVVQLMAV